MKELIIQKLAIAKRAGELNTQIESFVALAERISHKKRLSESITVQVHAWENSSQILRGYDIDPDGTELHDAILLFLNSQIDKRKNELDDLIKVIQ